MKHRKDIKLVVIVKYKNNVKDLEYFNIINSLIFNYRLNLIYQAIKR